VDGLIRYRLNDAPHGAVADLIRWANAQTAPILVLDILSWVDGASGTVFDPAIGETATMTLPMPKPDRLLQKRGHWSANSTVQISALLHLSMPGQHCHRTLGCWSPRVSFCGSTNAFCSRWTNQACYSPHH
jgi:YjeF-related protein N-terminus